MEATKAKVKVREAVEVDDGMWEIQSVATKAILGVTCLIGMWSIVCIVSAFTAVGPVALLAGLVGAIV